MTFRRPRIIVPSRTEDDLGSVVRMSVLHAIRSFCVIRTLSVCLCVCVCVCGITGQESLLPSRNITRVTIHTSFGRRFAVIIDMISHPQSLWYTEHAHSGSSERRLSVCLSVSVSRAVKYGLSAPLKSSVFFVVLCRASSSSSLQ